MKKGDFKNKNITIMGLGIVGGGVGTVKFLVENGAKVLVTDLRNKEELKDSLEKIKRLPVELVLERHRAKDFIYPDMIIRNPAVPDDSPYLKIARKNEVPVETDIGIFFQLSKAPIIGITGTKGKSTVATLVYLLLKSKFSDTHLAGNIGSSPLESLKEIKKNSKVVLELSSWQLQGLEKHKKSPHISLITNIYPDHLDRYQDFKEYAASKKLIFQFQKKKDFLLLNYDDDLVRGFSQEAESKVLFFSKKDIPGNLQKAAFIAKEEIFFQKQAEPIFHLKDLKLAGEHNISNVLAAVSIARISNISSKNIQKVLEKFQGLSGREELVREINGIQYINDTTATMPYAVISALQTLSSQYPKSNIVLIAGGQDKKLDYHSLAKEISLRVSHLILFPGSASLKIEEKMKNKKSKKFRSITTKIYSMQKAVKIASHLAGKGDIVLLSPGAASFNIFQNEFDRGAQFQKIVKQLKKE